MRTHLQEVITAYQLQPRTPPVAIQGGYVAYVHRIDGVDGSTVFTKTYDAQRTVSGMILPTLPEITAATRALGREPSLAGRIVAPLMGPLVVDERYTTVVFPFIDGITPRETPLTDDQLAGLITTVARLHTVEYTAAVYEGVPREDFVPMWRDQVVPGLTAAAQPGHALADLIAPRLERLLERYTAFLAHAEQLAQRAHQMVLCHTDIHGYNVVIADDLPLLIDWEGLKIAPREHDLMFWNKDDTWEHVRRVYTAVLPQVPIDDTLLQWYHVRRNFEDLIQDVLRVTHEHPDAVELADLRGNVAEISRWILEDDGTD